MLELLNWALSVEWGKVSIFAIMAIVIIVLIIERKKMINELKLFNDKLEKRVEAHLKDVMDLSNLNGELSVKLEKLIQSLVTILELIKDHNRHER